MIKLFSLFQSDTVATQPKAEPRKRTSGKERAQRFAEAEQRSRERWLKQQEMEDARRRARACQAKAAGQKRINGSSKAKQQRSRPEKRDTGFDPYRVLGIAATATAVDIKQAYRTLCRQYHPDLHPNDPVAEERFKQVQAAHVLLV